MLIRIFLPWIALAAVLGFAIGGTVVDLSFEPPPQQSAAVERADQSTKSDSSKITIPKSPDERIADYTWWLGAFTFALVVVSSVQILFLIRTDKTARITAEAAKLSAGAAVAADLPHVFISEIILVENKDAVWPEPLRSPFIKLEFKNYGRTPAFLVQQSVNITTAKALPDSGVYSSMFEFPPGVAIERDAVRSNTFLAEHGNDLNTIADILERRTSLWIYGYINYQDFLGQFHEMGFCAHFVPAQGLSPAGGFRVGRGPPRYTYKHVSKQGPPRLNKNLPNSVI